MGRTEHLNDPAAPEPNSLVPAARVLAVDRRTGRAGFPRGGRGSRSGWADS